MLRRDNPETQDIRYRLGQWRTLRTHLVPVLLAERENLEIVFHCGRPWFICARSRFSFSVISHGMPAKPLVKSARCSVAPLSLSPVCVAVRLFVRLTMPI